MVMNIKNQYKSCFKAALLENKISRLKKIDVDSLQEDHKEFIKNRKLILQTQQTFRSKRHNLFTEEIYEDCFKFK